MTVVKPVLGWREWVALPDLGVKSIKAKLDTGARSSALHAYDLERFRARGHDMVRFTIHPIQRSITRTIVAEAPLLDERMVRSSNGQQDLRVMIETDVEILGERWPIELSLTRRDVMGFRMLLGRQAIRRRYLIDPGRSYIGGKPAKRKSRRHPRAVTVRG